MDLTDKRRSRGRLIDASARFLQAAGRESPATEACHGVEEAAPVSGPRLLGQRADGAVELDAWRARWLPIVRLEFTSPTDDAHEGSLHVFHDKRSNALECFMMDHEGKGIRQVLTPAQAMRLLIAVNAAYGFDPKGPDGRSLDDAGDDPGPLTA